MVDGSACVVVCKLMNSKRGGKNMFIDEGSYLTEESDGVGDFSEGIPVTEDYDDPWPEEDDYDE